MSAWKIAQPTTTTDGALLLTSDAGGPYNALLVWFDKDRAVRIIARHSPLGCPSRRSVRWNRR